MRNSSASSGLMRGLLMVAAAIFTAPATASITYDYTHDWMFDSQSDLYWQVLPVSLSTFVPDTGTIATSQQLTDLGTDAGFPLFAIRTTPSAYSAPLADMLSFFQYGTPAPAPEQRANFSVFALYDYGMAEAPPNHFEYTLFTYSLSDVLGPPGDWLYSGSTTLGTYGPTSYACPGAVSPVGPGCPPTEPAFIVSTVQPVPLPAAIWMLLCGLGVLAGRGLRSQGLRPR